MMGLFGGSTKNETKIVLNFNTFATNGHFLCVTNEPVKDIMRSRKHTLKVRPRDYHESNKDYDKVCNTEYILPVPEGYLLSSNGLSEYKEVLIAIPNRIEDLPHGLHPDLKEALMLVILKKNTNDAVITAMSEGLRNRDHLLKMAYSLDFAKDYKDNVDKWVKDAYNREMPKYPKQEDKGEE
jgi:hypothetical protein